jgi:hypothetical protein
MNGIVENVLGLARRERARPNTWTWASSSAASSPNTGRAIRWRTTSWRPTCRAQPVAAMVDRRHLQQVVTVLVHNALVYGRLPGEPARIGVHAHLDAGGAPVLDVTDRGPGIPETVAAQLFRPFFTTSGNTAPGWASTSPANCARPTRPAWTTCRSRRRRLFPHPPGRRARAIATDLTGRPHRRCPSASYLDATRQRAIVNQHERPRMQHPSLRPGRRRRTRHPRTAGADPRAGWACACDTAASLADARALLRHNAYALCLTDMRLPDGSGMELVARSPSCTRRRRWR